MPAHNHEEPETMSWNYRIVRIEIPNSAPMYELHEVYYTGDLHTPYMRTENPTGFVGDSQDEVIASLDTALMDARNLPVLDDADIISGDPQKP